ncbi:MAG: MBL fold metallo-hydrolase [Candidatus Baldrarchaeia archaeon]
MSSTRRVALKYIKIRPLAAESLGVRSMATFVKTPDVNILIDASAALGFRYGLVPHPLEYRAVERATNEIMRYAYYADIITLSHLHWDHFKPFFEEYRYIWSNREIAEAIYTDKIILGKDYQENINFSQRKRGYSFYKDVKKVARKVEFADGKAYVFGNTIVKFSTPVPHGEENTPLGYVLMCTIKYENETFIHTSDVQGPVSEKTLNLILKEKPDVIYVSGPPTYLERYRVKEETIRKAKENLTKLARNVHLIIIDHHLLRDLDWRAWIQSAAGEAEINKHEIVCVSEYLNKEPRQLEASRQILYQQYPPSEEFEKWKNDQEKKEEK